MAIRLRCPNPTCGVSFSVAENLLGRNARCKSCKTVFRIALEAETPPLDSHESPSALPESPGIPEESRQAPAAKALKPVRGKRRFRRALLATVPVVIWFLAIGAAVKLHPQFGAAGSILGYAEDRQVTLAHLQAGVVQSVHVRLHETVQPGQILLRMDDAHARTQLEAVRQEIEQLTAQVAAEQARLVADNARSRRDSEDLARRFLAEREAAHIAYLTQVTDDAQDRVQLRGDLAEFDIVRKLYEKDQAPFREFNAFQTRVDALKARIDSNEEAIARMKKAFEDADQRWFHFTKREDAAVAHDPVLTAVRLAADVRERELDLIIRRIDEHVLRSPVRGQVTTLFAEAGDSVMAGSPLIAIASTATQRIVAYLPEEKAASIRVGDAIAGHRMASGAGPQQPIAAEVVSLSAVVTEAPPRYRKMPNWPVWGRAMVVALNADEFLMPGEAVRIGPSR